MRYCCNGITSALTVAYATAAASKGSQVSKKGVMHQMNNVTKYNSSSFSNSTKASKMKSSMNSQSKGSIRKMMG